jgi:WD40 domain-containing protein
MVFLAGWLSIIAASLLFGFTAVGVFLLITIAVLLVVARVLSTHRRWDDRRITKARETLRAWCAPNARLPQVGRRRIIWLYRLASFRHAFSPDRRCLAAGLDEQVHLWDLDECWFICRLDVQEQVLCIEFSPNGSYVPVGTTDRILIADAPSGKQLRALNAKDEWPAEMKFSPDGGCLASTNDE